MNPVIAQILVATIQALIQAISAKLSHEERAIVVVDPSTLKADEEVAAYRLICSKAILLRHIASDDQAKA